MHENYFTKSDALFFNEDDGPDYNWTDYLNEKRSDHSYYKRLARRATRHNMKLAISNGTEDL